MLCPSKPPNGQCFAPDSVYDNVKQEPQQERGKVGHWAEEVLRDPRASQTHSTRFGQLRQLKDAEQNMTAADADVARALDILATESVASRFSDTAIRVMLCEILLAGPIHGMEVEPMRRSLASVMARLGRSGASANREAEVRHRLRHGAQALLECFEENKLGCGQLHTDTQAPRIAHEKAISMPRSAPRELVCLSPVSENRAHGAVKANVKRQRLDDKLATEADTSSQSPKRSVGNTIGTPKPSSENIGSVPGTADAIEKASPRLRKYEYVSRHFLPKAKEA